ncbi:MAG: SDR family oxidoreductase [Gammaproteobacteria bacterium]
MESVLIVGCGHVGRRVAVSLHARGQRVTGLVRSPASAGQLRALGIDALCFDLDDGARPVPRMGKYGGLCYFAPPPSSGLQDTRMRGFLESLDKPPLPRRIVYISTSAVYGDCRGDWITEDQPVQPATDRGLRRLEAERQLQAWAARHGVEWVILRVPGIYGPGKLPLERLRKGLPMLREADAPYTNRIHADDLAAICVAALDSAHHDTVYNVSDGHPSTMTNYFFRVADAAGLPRPPVVTRDEAHQVLSEGMLSFLQDSRRIDNRKLLRDLGVTLQYPDLEAGLRSCFPHSTGVDST